MIDISTEDKIFLKKLKRLRNPSEEDLIHILFLYKKLIGNTSILTEYEECGCPGVIRDMHFELVMLYGKYKKEIDKKV